jgi:carbon storage regulator
MSGFSLDINNIFSTGVFTSRSWEEPIMLVLSRRVGEEILVGDDMVVTVVRIQGGRVRLGISAPRFVRVIRGELRDQPFKNSDGSSAIAYETRVAGSASDQT